MLYRGWPACISVKFPVPIPILQGWIYFSWLTCYWQQGFAMGRKDSYLLVDDSDNATKIAFIEDGTPC